MSVYFLYFLGIFDGTSFCYGVASKQAGKRCIAIADSGTSRVATWTTKVLTFFPSTTWTNSRLLINSTLLAVGKALMTVNNVSMSFLASNS